MPVNEYSGIPRVWHWKSWIHRIKFLSTNHTYVHAWKGFSIVHIGNFLLTPTESHRLLKYFYVTADVRTSCLCKLYQIVFAWGAIMPLYKIRSAHVRFNLGLKYSSNVWSRSPAQSDCSINWFGLSRKSYCYTKFNKNLGCQNSQLQWISKSRKNIPAPT